MVRRRDGAVSNHGLLPILGDAPKDRLPWDDGPRNAAGSQQLNFAPPCSMKHPKYYETTQGVQ
jgi:hypothetical protein